MSLTLAGLFYAVKRTVKGEPWEKIQRERARRDYRNFMEQDGDIMNIYSRALRNRPKLSSSILEPGYWEETMDLISEEEDLMELRDRYLEIEEQK